MKKTPKTKEISKIFLTFDKILNESRLLTEAFDRSGINELVYNPVTKPGGSLGWGYDNGVRQSNGIRWDGHDNHLHISFTNRDVAKMVIDKARERGLTVSENPYPTGRPISTQHVHNSFHYSNFVGDPKIGMAVDISGGDENKIKEFILWIDDDIIKKQSYNPSPNDRGQQPASDQQPTSGQTSNNQQQFTPDLKPSNVGQDTFLLGLGQEIGKGLGMKENFTQNKKVLSQIDKIKKLIK